MNASTLFNDFASAKNFSKVGNRVTSTQPGRPFAGTEALNYIPVGYNTSGGDMFKYGNIKFLAEGFAKKGGGFTKSASEIKELYALAKAELKGNIENRSRVIGWAKKNSGAGADQSYLVEKMSVERAEARHADYIRENPRKFSNNNTTPNLPSSEERAYAREQQIRLNDSNQRIRKGEQQRLENEARHREMRANAEARQAEIKANIDKGLTAEGRKSVSSNINLERANGTTNQDKPSVFKLALDANDKQAAKKAAKKTKGPPVPNNTGGNGKLGNNSFAGADAWFNGINGKAKYAFAAAGGVAALTAGGITLSQIQGSKNSPVGAAVVMGGVAGLGAVGAKYGARGILGGVLGGKIKSSSAMRGAMKSSINNIGNMNMKTIGTVAGVGAAAGLGLGVTRNVTGV